MTEHKLAHILRAIADGVPVQGEWVSDGDWWDFDPSKHAFITSSNISWRIKPKSKVKKWRWAVARKSDPSVIVITAEYFRSEDEFHRSNTYYSAVQKIDSTMIEVEEDDA